MSSERAVFTATLDLKEVEANLQAARTSIGKGIGDPLAGALGNVEKASAKGAKAVSALTAVLGQTAGSSSAVVRGLGDVAGALAAGGPVMVALSVAGLAIGALATKWNDAKKAADEAANAGVDAAKSIVKALDEAVKAKDAAGIGALYGAKTEQEVKVAGLRSEVSGLRYEIGQLERTAPKGFASWFSDSDDKLEIARKRLAALSKELKEAEALLRRLSVGSFAPVGGGTAPPGGGGKPGGGKRSGSPKVDSAMAAEWELFDFQREVAAEQAEQHQADIDEWMAEEQMWRGREVALLEATEKKKTATVKKAAKERAAIETDAYVGMAQTVALTVAELAVASANGQNDALASALAALSVQAGGVIMLEGGKVLSAGIAGAFLGNPIAPMQIAGGLGLIGVGAAVQVGGPEAVKAMAASLGGGAGPGAAKADRGAPIERRARGGGGGGSGGGGITIVNQWGVAGPTADDQARAFRRAIDRMGDGRF